MSVTQDYKTIAFRSEKSWGAAGVALHFYVESIKKSIQASDDDSDRDYWCERLECAQAAIRELKGSV